MEMKILCNPNKEDGKRHYRNFPTYDSHYKHRENAGFFEIYHECKHCKKFIHTKKLKAHTCKARLKELKK